MKLKLLCKLALAAFLNAACAVALAQPAVFYFGHTGTAKSLDAIGKPTAEQLKQAKVVQSQSGISWNVVYLDAAGSGFNDSTLGATRKATLQAVLSYIDSVIDHPGASVSVQVESSQFDGSGFLAQAGTSYALANGYDAGDCFLKIVQGQDRFAGSPEIDITVDFGWNWNSGLSAPGATQYDLFSVLLHECTHALGVTSLASATGASFFTTTTFSTFDNLLYQESPHNKAWSSAFIYQLAPNGLLLGDSTLGFEGVNAVSAFGQAPPIYTPTTFATGSSVSHWQLTSPIPSSAVMRPAIASGVQNRSYQEFEKQTLKDLGYTLHTAAAQDWQLME